MAVANTGSFQGLVILGIFVILILIWKTKKQRELEHFSGTVRSIPYPPRPLKIAIACLIRKPIDLALWLEHHRKLGITQFYFRVEDSPGTIPFLKTQDDIYYEEGISDKSNNYTTLITRQLEFVNKILLKAQKDGVDWIFHTDCDELIEGDIVGTLMSLPENILIGKIKNAEAVYKEDEETCFSAEKFIRCDKDGPCTAYVNGKGVGRPVKGVTLGGPHDFVYNGKVDPDVTYQVPFEAFHVLHYDSCTIGSWLEKFNHLSKNAKMDDIVFSYYKKSIDAAKKAVDIYKEHKMREDLAPEWTYIRNADSKNARDTLLTS